MRALVFVFIIFVIIHISQFAIVVNKDTYI